MIARVWGPADGPQARFVRLPANTKLPGHKHTATVRVVVVSGTYVYGLQGEPEKRYDAGSFVLTPGGVAHVAGCSDACVYFEELGREAGLHPGAGPEAAPPPPGQRGGFIARGAVTRIG